jgi:hypothetical protein
MTTTNPDRRFVVDGHGATTIRYPPPHDHDLTPAGRRVYDALMAPMLRRAEDAGRAAYAAGLRGDFSGLEDDDPDADEDA